MPELTELTPPSRQPPAEPTAVAPHREQAVVSCALLGYWTEPGAEPGAERGPCYRHRLGLHADLDYTTRTARRPASCSAPPASACCWTGCAASASTGT